MYTRFICRLCRISISSRFSRRDPLLSITPSSYEQLVTIASKRPTDSLTRSLHFSKSSCREADTATMSNESMHYVDYNELLEAQKDDKVLIVDVREQDEINETGKLPGSIHIPMGDVQYTFLNLLEEEFEKRYGKPKPTKDTKIIFSCRSGRRSAAVQEAMQKLGYTKAYNYPGGWLEWKSKQNKNN